MKTKNYKGMMGITIFASLLCIVSVVWILVQSYCISTGSGEGCIVWHEELYPVQWCVFIGRLVLKSAFYVLIMVFLFKQLKAIRDGVLFPAVNVKIMYSIALCYLIGSTCDDNVSTTLLMGESGGSFVINGDTLLYAALLVVFALIYKIAVKVSEENNLTI